MRLTTILLLALMLAGCGAARHEPADQGELTWAWMGDDLEDMPPLMDTGGEWWEPGDPLTSALPDGSNEIVIARLDSFGQWQPVCKKEE